MEVPDSELVGRVVMVVWHQAHAAETIQPLLKGLMERVGETGRVVVENAERLSAVTHPQSSVDVVLSGFLPPPSLSHSPSLLAEIAGVLKPFGTVLLREPVTLGGPAGGLRPLSKVTSALKLSGFVDISEVRAVSVDQAAASDLRRGLLACGVTLSEAELGGVAVAHVQAKKPSYEVGASSSLSFASRLQSHRKEERTVSSETAKIWSLSAADTVEDDLDLLDSNTLLEEEDLIQPDPSSLKTQCGAEGGKKKKACKDCTCGLAEQLAGGQEVEPRPVTSSCGSCYLGDAFRCASCPYLGMPAFKPGEQIHLSSRQLKADQ